MHILVKFICFLYMMNNFIYTCIILEVSEFQHGLLHSIVCDHSPPPRYSINFPSAFCLVLGPLKFP